MAELANLFDRYNSDKEWYHHYSGIYETLFADRRHRTKRVLELGVFEGSSLLAWADYFPGADIHGVDIDLSRCAHIFQTPAGQAGRFHTYLGDAAGPKMLSKLRMNGPYDVIIDDASHTIEDQLASLLGLWHALADGGLYVIEDHVDPAHFYTLTHLPGAELFALVEEERGSLLVVHKP